MPNVGDNPSKLSRKSDVTRVVQYTLGHWTALLRYAADDRLEIDNNAAERALRAVVLGRKNCMFAGSDAGGEHAAAIYSLIGTAKLNGIDPEAYLSRVLPWIPDHPVRCIDELRARRLANSLVAESVLPPDTASTDRVHNGKLWTQPGSVSQCGSSWTINQASRNHQEHVPTCCIFV